MLPKTLLGKEEQVDCAGKYGAWGPAGIGRTLSSLDEARMCQTWLEKATDGREPGSKTPSPPPPRVKELILIR